MQTDFNKLENANNSIEKYTFLNKNFTTEKIIKNFNLNGHLFKNCNFNGLTLIRSRIQLL